MVIICIGKNEQRIKKLKILDNENESKYKKGFYINCKTQFLINSIVEIDLVICTYKGSKDVYSNIQLLHKHCHIAKIQNDNLQSKKIILLKLCETKRT